jgi:glycosyltransferase involved in cell wall biosynthesis
MKRVLWLASWFPNRLDPLAGDFIERHAEAASLYNDIFVLHVVKDNELNIPGKMLKETKSLTKHCQVAITYYQTGFKRFRWLHVIQSNFRYCSCYYHSIRAYIKERGRPDCIHVHIALKAGFIALLAKKIYGIPYIVSEQWTGLCPEAKPGLDDRNWLFRWFWKMVMENASTWSAVSEYLGNSIQQKFKLSGFSVIPNIVNTEIFYPEVHLPGPFRFIHVSVMNYQKNPEQIFEAIALLKQKTQDHFIVFLFGGLSAALKELAEKLDINDQIAVMSPRPQPILAKDMRSSGALILYSRFETFGCVIIEANACGLPVIVSNIPVLHENVVDGVTGIFVPLDDPGKLADQMAWMMQHAKDFDKEKMITLTKEKYSYMRAGEAFDRLYRQLHPGLEN